MNTNTEENNPETNLQWVKGQLIKKTFLKLMQQFELDQIELKSSQAVTSTASGGQTLGQGCTCK